MKKLIALLAASVLVLASAALAIAADGPLDDTGRILIAISGDVDVPEGEHAEAVIVINGNASVAGEVTTLILADGTATTGAGAMLDSIAVFNGTVELASGTTVRGDVSYFNSTVNRADDVTVGGAVTDVAGDVAAFGLFMGAAAIVLWIGFAIATILIGLLLAGLAARQVRLATKVIGREPGRTFLVGLLAILLPPVLAVIAFVTIIGIPAGLGLLLVVWPFAAFIGYMVAAIFIGEWLLGRRQSATPSQWPYLAAVLGLAVAFLLGFIPLVTAVISTFGLGAVVLAALRTLRGGSAPAVAPQPQPAPVA